MSSKSIEDILLELRTDRKINIIPRTLFVSLFNNGFKKKSKNIDFSKPTLVIPQLGVDGTRFFYIPRSNDGYTEEIKVTYRGLNIYSPQDFMGDVLPKLVEGFEEIYRIGTITNEKGIVVSRRKCLREVYGENI